MMMSRAIRTRLSAAPTARAALFALFAAAALGAGGTACDRSQPATQTPAAPAPAAPAPAPAAPAPADANAALGRRLDAAIDQAVSSGNIVGAVVLVARDGAVVYHRAAGFADREAKQPVTEDTIFRLASMTKPIVSAAALALVDEGKLRLEDPVAKWLPGFKPKLPNGKPAVITVRHLITHTSGIGYGFMQPPTGPYAKAKVSDGLGEPGLAWEENEKRLASVPLLFEPGAQFQYGLSIDVLGAVVSRAGGAPLGEVVRRTVTGPLDMKDTTFTVTEAQRPRLAAPYADGTPPKRMTEPYKMTGPGGAGITFSPARILDPKSYPSGGAGAAGTARDYLRFAEALRTGGAPVLKPETMQAMAQNQIGALKPFGQEGNAFGYGLGIVLDPAAAKTPTGKGTLSWGGAYGTGFWVDPGAKLSVVIMTNNAASGMDFGGALEKVVYGP